MAHARIEQFEAKLAITSGRREAAEACIHPGKLTYGTQKWRFGRCVPFCKVNFRFHVDFAGCRGDYTTQLYGDCNKPLFQIGFRG